jgi:hypothetical protein
VSGSPPSAGRASPAAATAAAAAAAPTPPVPTGLPAAAIPTRLCRRLSAN